MRQRRSVTGAGVGRQTQANPALTSRNRCSRQLQSCLISIAGVLARLVPLGVCLVPFLCASFSIGKGVLLLVGIILPAATWSLYVLRKSIMERRLFQSWPVVQHPPDVLVTADGKQINSEGRAVPPSHWGISQAQLRDFYFECRGHENWRRNMSVRELDREIIRDLFQDGKGVALSYNDSKPLRNTYLVSHSWDENAATFFEDILNTDFGLGAMFDDCLEGIFICFLAIYQGTNDELQLQVAQGPTGTPVEQGCFAKVLESVKGEWGTMFVVPNEELCQNGQGLYSRLWCVWEAHNAVELGVQVRISPLERATEGHLFGQRGRAGFSSANSRCGSASDELMIRDVVSNSKGQWEAIDNIIVHEFLAAEFFTKGPSDLSAQKRGCMWRLLRFSLCPSVAMLASWSLLFATGSMLQMVPQIPGVANIPGLSSAPRALRHSLPRAFDAGMLCAKARMADTELLGKEGSAEETCSIRNDLVYADSWYVFSFANCLWVFGVTGLCIALGPSIWHLLLPLRRLLQLFIDGIRDAVIWMVAQFHRWGAWESLAYLASFLISVEANRMPADKGFYVASVGLLVFAAAFRYTASLHGFSDLADEVRDRHNIDLVSMCWFLFGMISAPEAVRHESHLLGHVSTACFLQFLILKGVGNFLARSISKQDQGHFEGADLRFRCLPNSFAAAASAMASAAIVIFFGVVCYIARACNLSPRFLMPFRASIITFGIWKYYWYVLMLCSTENPSLSAIMFRESLAQSREFTVRVVQALMRSDVIECLLSSLLSSPLFQAGLRAIVYLMPVVLAPEDGEQRLMLCSLFTGMGCGAAFCATSLFNISILFSVLFAVQQIPWHAVYKWYSLLAFSLIVVLCSLYLKERPDFIPSLISSDCFVEW